MGKFGKALFGYNQKVVDQLLVDRKREAESMINAKYGELDAVRANIQRTRANIRMAEKEIEDFARRKEQIFNTFVDQLVIIEQSIKSNDEGIRRANLEALEHLEQKVQELDKWNSLLQQFYSEINAIGSKYRAYIEE